MATSGTTCANCNQPLDALDLAAEPRVPCPHCGSTARGYTEKLVDGLRLFDSQRARLKRPSLPSDRKLRWESFDGYEFNHDRQKMVRKVRMYDKDTDEYVGRVTDIETGEIIHECVEPFSEHVGHGTAKKKQP
jgi:hypothetical protein